MELQSSLHGTSGTSQTHSPRRVSTDDSATSSKTEEAASLFFSTGTTFEEYRDEEADMSVKGPHRNFRMVKADKRENIIMIASEPLTFQKEDWIEVPSQTCLVITHRVSLSSPPTVS